MAKVTLVGSAKTYTVMKQRLAKGVATNVPDDVAAYLDGDKRFVVDWEGKTPVAKSAVTTAAPSTTKAAPTAPAADLMTAINQVDAELDENFDDDGKPSVAALSKLLGRSITEEERDAAFATAVKPTRVVEPATRTRIIKKPAATTTDSTAAPAAAAAAPAADPTTEGAKAV